jgi:hypothetical protein
MENCAFPHENFIFITKTCRKYLKILYLCKKRAKAHNMERYYENYKFKEGYNPHGAYGGSRYYERSFHRSNAKDVWCRRKSS